MVFTGSELLLESIVYVEYLISLNLEESTSPTNKQTAKTLQLLIDTVIFAFRTCIFAV